MQGPYQRAFVSGQRPCRSLATRCEVFNAAGDDDRARILLTGILEVRPKSVRAQELLKKLDGTNSPKSPAR